MNRALEMARELVKQSEEAEKENKVQLSKLNPGEVFKIGEYNFVVLEHERGSTKVISKGFMAEDIIFDESTRDYSKSNLKNVIEEKNQPIIEMEVGVDNIVEHTVDLLSVDMQHEFNNYICKVRPITFDEARKYNDLLENEDVKRWWWTCTPWSTAKRGWEYSLAVVSASGIIYDNICINNCGVRPVCILKSNIFVSKGE